MLSSVIAVQVLSVRKEVTEKDIANEGLKLVPVEIINYKRTSALIDIDEIEGIKKAVIDESTKLVPVEIISVKVSFNNYYGRVIYRLRNLNDHKTGYEYTERGTASEDLLVKKFNYALIGVNAKTKKHIVVQPSYVYFYDKENKDEKISENNVDNKINNAMKAVLENAVNPPKNKIDN